MPVYTLLAAKGWTAQAPQYKPLERINRARDQNNDFFRPELAYNAPCNADPQKGEYHDYLQRVLNFAQSGVSFSDAAKMAKYQALSKEGEGRYAVTLKLVINKRVETSTNLDFSKAMINKINDGLYIVSGIAGDYNNGAGTYIFAGNWDDGPKWDGPHFSMEPRFAMDGKKLSVQAFYVNIGCNDQLAAIILKNIDLNNLSQLLQTKP